jgi:hypothetical protein
VSKFAQKFIENRGMDFWTRLKNQIKLCKQTQEGVSVTIKVPFGTFRKWMDRKTYPDAGEVVKLAVLLKTTVEELVDGEAGEQYLREYIQEKGWGFSPPERVAGIVEAANSLSDEQLDYVMGLIKTMLDKKVASGVPPEE